MLLTLAVATLAAACSQHAPPSAPDARAAFNAADVQFVQQMLPHHAQAIQLAGLVTGRTRRPELVRLAASITSSEAAELQTMRGLLRRWQQPVPPADPGRGGDSALGMASEGQVRWLASLRGRPFDLGFATMMQAHHVGGIELAQAVVGQGRSSEVRMLAYQIQTSEQHELDELGRWHDAWV
jgi:uncharacterized protein (DUF305 family)